MYKSLPLRGNCVFSMWFMLGVPIGLIGGCVGKKGTPLMGGSSTLGTERRSELKQLPILSEQLSAKYT